MSDASRRNFLRGKVAEHTAQQRPPWALPEAHFTAVCTRCGDCARACPTRIIRQGDGGYPTVDFSQRECTFCGDCAAACRPLALAGDGLPAWPYKALINASCLTQRGVECRVCGDFCDVRAILFAPRIGSAPLPSIDTDACTGCGACVAPCPTAAIRIGI